MRENLISFETLLIIIVIMWLYLKLVQAFIREDLGFPDIYDTKQTSLKTSLKELKRLEKYVWIGFIISSVGMYYSTSDTSLQFITSVMAVASTFKLFLFFIQEQDSKS